MALKLVTLLLMLSCSGACLPRYHFDIEVLSATIIGDALPEEPATARRSAQPFIVVEFVASPEFTEGNQSADLLACETHRDFVSGHPSPEERGHGLVSGVARTVNGKASYRAVFLREDIEPFMEATGDPNEAGASWRMKPNYRANGLCFRARIPNVMHYGVSREFRIDQMLSSPPFSTDK